MVQERDITMCVHDADDFGEGHPSRMDGHTCVVMTMVLFGVQPADKNARFRFKFRDQWSVPAESGEATDNVACWGDGITLPLATTAMIR